MTSPKLAFPLRGRGRHYPYPPQDPSGWPRNQWGSVNPDDVPVEAVPSVTNVLSVCDKPGLKGWAAEQALRSLYESGHIPLDVERAIQSHKWAFNDVSERRADAGTRAHTLAERLTQDLPLPSSISEEDEAYADAFLKFWSDTNPEPLEVEVTMYGDGYAGTADLIANLTVNFSRGPRVVDYKTRGVRPDPKKKARYGLLYDENRMQLAALAHCPQVALEGSEGWELLPAPQLEGAVGVALYPDGTYDLEEVADLDRWYQGFRGALKLWKGLRGVA